MFPSVSLRFIKQQKFTAEDQQIYNNHIIENFIDSVKEMNGAVLIPSKLRDLESEPNPLNDDLFQYFKMINTVKNDLFEPHLHEEVNSSVFTPKHKISRALIQRKEENNSYNERKISSVSAPPPLLERKISTVSNSSSRVSSCSDFGSLTQENDPNLDLKSQSPTQLTDQFIHHLHSLYHILEHFTKAADYITEQYIEQVEQIES